MNQKLLLIGIILLILVGAGSYILGTKKSPSVQTNSLSISPTAVQPNEISDPTANWKTYSSEIFNFSFKYPLDWKITYDQQPDPEGNPDKYSLNVEKNDSIYLSVTMFKPNSQYQTFESLYNILNLPSGTAIITSRKEMEINGKRGLYILQNNGKEGIIIFDSKTNMIILETESSNKQIFDQILSTFKFTN